MVDRPRAIEDIISDTDSIKSNRWKIEDSFSWDLKIIHKMTNDAMIEITDAIICDIAFV